MINIYFFILRLVGVDLVKEYPEIVKIINELNTDKVLFYKIDISNEDNNEIVEKCEVTSVPTFMLFKDRSIINRVLADG